MNLIALQFILLAERANWKSLGDGLSGDGAMLSTNELLGLCALAVGIVVLVSVLSKLSKMADSKKPYNEPKRLFRELCDAHQLSRKDRGALKNLAEYLQLSQPALLLVQPDSFPVQDWPASWPSSWPSKLAADAERLDAIYDRLFAGEIDRTAA